MAENHLVLLDTARQALAQAKTIPDVKEILDKVEVIKMYLKRQGYSWEIQTTAAEITIETKAKLGEMIQGMPKNEGGRPEKNPLPAERGFLPNLSQLGITHIQSHRCQTIAILPEGQRRQYYAEVRDAGPSKELTSAGVYQLAKKWIREQERQIIIDQIPLPDWNGELQLNTVHLVAVENLSDLLPSDSIDMIFTDPPYSEADLVCYEGLGKLALQVLRPGRYCAIYCGKMFLPEIFHIMASYLDYIWTFAIFHPFSQARINKYELFENWRPLVLFKKPGDFQQTGWVQDVVRGKRDKELYDWQQDMEAPLQYIPIYTKPGEIVLDPFVGSGTIPIACQQLNRHYIAFDDNPETIKIAIARVDSVKTNFS